MSLSGIIGKLASVATDLAPLVGVSPALTTIAKAVLSTVTEVTNTVELPDDQAAVLEGARAELEARVNAHADATADRLADPPP